MVRTAAILGPTASGKSETALLVAKALPAEIISCDSVQVYRRMDIGSGKLPPEQRQGVPHHMLDVADPREPYSVARYQQEARRAILEVADRGNLPLLCGGTGLYLRAALDDYDFPQEQGEGEIRRRLKERLEKEGPEALHRDLALQDPPTADKLHPRDSRRVIRALEVLEETGRPQSSLQHARRESLYPVRMYGLMVPREELYRRIDARVEGMLAAGLEAETRDLLSLGVDPESPAMQTLGYRHMVQWIRGELEYGEAVRRMKRDTRHYAKRQYTWFNRDPRILWLPAGTPEELEDSAGRIVRDLREFLASGRL